MYNFVTFDGKDRKDKKIPSYVSMVHKTFKNEDYVKGKCRKVFA
jgi:hypothetical protein